MSDRSKFIRLNATETAALRRVLTRICAGNDHAEAVVLQGVLGRLERVWMQPPKRRRTERQADITTNQGNNTMMSAETLSRRDASTDDLHKRLKAAVEVEETAYLWVPADAITFVPPLLSTIYGDGRALFYITTINDRPAHWIVRGDSAWQVQDYRAPDDAPDFGDFTDDILTDLEEEFGGSRCGYNGSSLHTPPAERVCTCEECSDAENIAKWPEVDGDGGCSWGRMDWPAGFETVPHPWSPRFNLLAPTKGATP